MALEIYQKEVVVFINAHSSSQEQQGDRKWKTSLFSTRNCAGNESYKWEKLIHCSTVVSIKQYRNYCSRLSVARVAQSVER